MLFLIQTFMWMLQTPLEPNLVPMAAARVPLCNRLGCHFKTQSQNLWHQVCVPMVQSVVVYKVGPELILTWTDFDLGSLLGHINSLSCPFGHCWAVFVGHCIYYPGFMRGMCGLQVCLGQIICVKWNTHEWWIKGFTAEPSHRIKCHRCRYRSMLSIQLWVREQVKEGKRLSSARLSSKNVTGNYKQQLVEGLQLMCLPDFNSN